MKAAIDNCAVSQLKDEFAAHTVKLGQLEEQGFDLKENPGLVDLIPQILIFQEHLKREAILNNESPDFGEHEKVREFS